MPVSVLKHLTTHLLFEESPAHAFGDCGGPFRDAQLVVDRLKVGLHCGRAQVDLLGDLGRRMSRGHELQHLPLAGCEHGSLLAPSRSWSSLASPVWTSVANAVPPSATVAIPSQISCRAACFER